MTIKSCIRDYVCEISRQYKIDNVNTYLINHRNVFDRKCTEALQTIIHVFCMYKSEHSTTQDLRTYNSYVGVSCSAYRAKER